MSVHSFVLFLPDSADPPTLPWAHECTMDNRKAARWVRIDQPVFGDGMCLLAQVFGLVIDGRDPDTVVQAFRDWSARELELASVEAILILKRHKSDACEVFSSRDGAPRLLGAMRERGRGGLV